MSMRPGVFSVVVLIVVILLAAFLRLDFENARLILLELRLPRLILALAVGGSLALSGLVMQTVLGNPLAEPYTLGVASGAALGAAISSSLGWQLSWLGLNLGGMVGALAIVYLLFRLGRGTQLSSGALVLTGVMLSLSSASLLAIWMALADPIGVQSINFWLLGDLSRVGLASALSVLALSVVVFFYFMRFSRRLDAFLLGTQEVSGFGVSPVLTLQASVLLVSVLVGFCVSAAGVIGFLGLIVPHVVRKKLNTPIHARLLPMVYLWGGIVLLASDTIGKNLAHPHELPVGAVTALVGAPLFIFLYRRQRHEVQE